MPSKTSALCLAITLAVLPIGVAHAESHSHAHGHEAHQTHEMGEHTLRLNNGSQWETDAPLRKAMGILRQDIHPLMPEIHNDRLSDDGYEALAQQVNDQVKYMIENCELEAEADAQLHLIIAELMAGANALQGEAEDQARRDGAIRVVGALNSYAAYFNDASFKKLGH
ncbi:MULTISPECIES: hypothetical protein [Pseudomonas]|uniref:hypothetical protein n=1 Tax=Pseudomonas TaxID=286 RepID=UPI00123984F0|nr:MULTISPECIES: hypothetical protein [Pseudomonas]QIB52159.1 hypothetical protein G3M63_14555 [Pseudomonas sp. OIL-1]